MKPKIKRSHYRKNINQVYYLLKLKPSCNKIQKCAQIILLHDEFYTLAPTPAWSSWLLFSVMYFKSTLRAPFTSLSMIAPQDGHLNVFEDPKFLFITPQHPQVLLVYSSVQMTTLHQGYSRGICEVNIDENENVTKSTFVSQF